MFSKCMSLSELNMARVKACADGVPIVDVNNAYNKRRIEIMSINSDFTKVTTVPVSIRKPESLCATLMYLGPSDKDGVIEITSSGVYA